MKFSTFLFAAILTLASANVAILNDSNYNSITSETSLVFIKFFAPWCGHCKAMAEDWVQLGNAMQEERPELLVAEVDCTSDQSEKLCKKNGIEGFPTLMYGDPDFLESYEGSREFDELYVFATSGGLKASCSPRNLELCDDKEKTKLEALMDMSIEELKKLIDDVDERVNAMESEFDQSTDVLEEEYREMMEISEAKQNKAKKEAHYHILKEVEAQKQQAANDRDEL